MAETPQIQLGAYQLGQGPTSFVEGSIVIGAPALSGTGSVTAHVTDEVIGLVSAPIHLPRFPPRITGDGAVALGAPRLRAAGTVIPVITGTADVESRPARIAAEGRSAPPITGTADLTVRTARITAQGARRMWLRQPIEQRIAIPAIVGVGQVVAQAPRAVSRARLALPVLSVGAASVPARRRMRLPTVVNADLRQQIVAEDDALALDLDDDWTIAA